tara:strand:- start:450 stop:629 length:180 start_codon:yes stop_codon:yes gene_type:complete
MNTIVKMKNTKLKQRDNNNNDNSVYGDRKFSHKTMQTNRRLARNNKQAVLHSYNDPSEY